MLEIADSEDFCEEEEIRQVDENSHL
jgi:hypothetical protein